MYSGSCSIFYSDKWRIVSFGNGAAYELINIEAYDSLFFQDDAAIDFHSEMKAWDDLELGTYDEFAENMWDEYHV